MTQPLEKWVDDLQTRGRYSFRREEAVAESGLTADGVRKALQRLVGKGRVAKLKDYFYAIVPLEYAAAGAPPPSWYIDDLMAAMELPYYVGLLSAAAQHGASHHQPQEFQVVTDRSVRPILVGRARVRFFASKYTPHVATEYIKTPTGRMCISALETTAVDLVRFAKAAGYLDNAATVINELAPGLSARRLLAAVKVAKDVPNAQRLGYILDQLGYKSLAEPLHKWIKQQGTRPVALRSESREAEGREEGRWHVLVGRELEVEV